jgi:hypothetical protein
MIAQDVRAAGKIHFGARPKLKYPVKGRLHNERN